MRKSSQVSTLACFSFYLQLSTIPVSPSDTRLTPAPRHCDFPAGPLPPRAVGGVELDLERTRYLSYDPDANMLVLEIVLSWLQPQGRVSGYRVRLVEFISTLEEGVGEIFAIQTVEVRIMYTYKQ